MRVLVGTSVTSLPIRSEVTPVIQNLGPGVLYIDADPAVSATSGFVLDVGSVYEYPRDLAVAAGAVYAVASQANTDVRILVVG